MSLFPTSMLWHRIARLFSPDRLIGEKLEKIDFLPIPNLASDTYHRHATDYHLLVTILEHLISSEVRNLYTWTESDSIDDIDIKEITAVVQCRGKQKADFGALAGDAGKPANWNTLSRDEKIASLRADLWEGLRINGDGYASIIKLDWNSQMLVMNDDCGHRFAELYNLSFIGEIKLPCQVRTMTLDEERLNLLTRDYVVLVLHPETGNQLSNLFSELALNRCSEQRESVGPRSKPTLHEITRDSPPLFRVIRKDPGRRWYHEVLRNCSVIFMPVNHPSFPAVAACILPRLSSANHINVSSWLRSLKELEKIKKATEDDLKADDVEAPHQGDA
jgi:hypothetical protein